LHGAKYSDAFEGHLTKSMDEYLGSLDYSLRVGAMLCLLVNVRSLPLFKEYE
jgi:hypothetical protein